MRTESAVCHGLWYSASSTCGEQRTIPKPPEPQKQGSGHNIADALAIAADWICTMSEVSCI